MIGHGCAVTALCPRGHTLGKVSGIGKIHRYSGADAPKALGRAVSAARPDIIVPCDDRAVWQLHELYEHRPDLRRLIETSLGQPNSFPVLRSRVGLSEAARQMGLRVPETRALDSEESARAWFREFPGAAAVKLDGTWGGSGVRIIEAPEQAIAALRSFHAPERFGSAWKRWLVDRDPLAFWSRERGGMRTVSIQKFVPGRPANTMLAAWQGRVLGTVSVEVLCTEGPTGASTVVRLIQNEEMTRAATALAEGLQLSGFYGLDFILEEGTEAAYLIEVNARCTQLGHLVLAGRGDLAGLLCMQLGARGSARTELPIDRDVIAFFPQALAWNPDSPYMQQCHHDIPWNEPALTRELMRDPWAERQWVARMYHWMRGKERSPLPSVPNLLRLAAQNGFASRPVNELTDLP